MQLSDSVVYSSEPDRWQADSGTYRQEVNRLVDKRQFVCTDRSSPLPAPLLVHTGRLAERALLLLCSVNASSGVSQEGGGGGVRKGRQRHSRQPRRRREEKEESSEDRKGANAANCPAEDERGRGRET